MYECVHACVKRISRYIHGTGGEDQYKFPGIKGRETEQFNNMKRWEWLLRRTFHRLGCRLKPIHVVKCEYDLCFCNISGDTAADPPCPPSCTLWSSVWPAQRGERPEVQNMCAGSRMHADFDTHMDLKCTASAVCPLANTVIRFTSLCPYQRFHVSEPPLGRMERLSASANNPEADERIQPLPPAQFQW